MVILQEKNTKWKHFTYEDRLVLENYWQGKCSYPKIIRTCELATIFEKSQRSIQRELARGMVEHLKSDLTTHTVYST